MSRRGNSVLKKNAAYEVIVGRGNVTQCLFQCAYCILYILKIYDVAGRVILYILNIYDVAGRVILYILNIYDVAGRVILNF